MKFEILKRSNLRRNIIIGIIVIGIISACILTLTRAKYRTTESISLANGTINYSLADLNIVAITVDGKETDQIPDGNYELTSESYCTVNGETDNNVKISYDSATKGLSVTPMTTKGTKCYLYFEERLCPTGAACNTILSGKEIKTRRLPLATSSKVEGNITGTIYKAEDDWGDTYYFAGNPTDNWVKFAGFYWRIIRINGDGSIRLIYQGTSANTTGSGTEIHAGKFNDNYNRSEYVGYMYTQGEQHGNTTDSPIKDVVDNWYSSNLAKYADKISKEAGFCGDRELQSGYSWSSKPNSTIYYAGYERLVQNSNNVNPTFKCSNSADLYTVSESSKGNHTLSNPIGLITADEVIMGGLSWSGSTANNYLNSKIVYWTMSPSKVNSDSWAYVFCINGEGQVFDYATYSVDGATGIRPVINIASNVTIKSGNGTVSSPYEI